MLSQTQVQFFRTFFELNEKSDHIPHDMMNNTTQLSTTQPGSAGFFFPREVMSLVLEYCDERGSAVKIQAVWRGYQARNEEEEGCIMCDASLKTIKFWGCDYCGLSVCEECCENDGGVIWCGHSECENPWISDDEYISGRIEVTGCCHNFGNGFCNECTD